MLYIALHPLECASAKRCKFAYTVQISQDERVVAIALAGILGWLWRIGDGACLRIFDKDEDEGKLVVFSPRCKYALSSRS